MNFNHSTRQGQPGIVACMGNTKATHCTSPAGRLCPQEPAWVPGPAGGSLAAGRQQPRSLGVPRLPHQAAKPREQLGFPACWRGAPLPWGGLPLTLRSPQKPLPPARRGAFCGQDSRGRERAALDVVWKPAPHPHGALRAGFHADAQPGLRTGTCFRSQPPGRGRRHCGVTSSAEKGAAHLPCYRNNTLADNCGIASNQSCFHTSENAPARSLHGHVGATAARPGPARACARGPSVAPAAPTASVPPGDRPPGARPPAARTPQQGWASRCRLSRRPRRRTAWRPEPSSAQRRSRTTDVTPFPRERNQVSTPRLSGGGGSITPPEPSRSGSAR